MLTTSSVSTGIPGHSIRILGTFIMLSAMSDKKRLNLDISQLTLQDNVITIPDMHSRSILHNSADAVGLTIFVNLICISWVGLRYRIAVCHFLDSLSVPMRFARRQRSFGVRM